jgi:hypothetical protein
VQAEAALQHFALLLAALRQTLLHRGFIEVQHRITTVLLVAGIVSELRDSGQGFWCDPLLLQQAACHPCFMRG